ncbi:MAG: DUF1015 domain-containing protein [bacterium]|nr:DUF1015 domain-containing protein [bacterium]
MARIKPLKGIRYNLNKVAIEDVVAPPYDVISSFEQDDLYQKSELNIIRLILGKMNDTDDGENNKYTRAAEFFNFWQATEDLIVEDKPAIYVYSQDFEFAEKSYSRTGFLSLLKQEPLFEGTIYPHERTLSKPKADRLNLTVACKSNFSPIFGLYNDESKIVKNILEEVIQASADIDFKIANGERNRVWVVTDEEKIKKLTETLKDEKIFIADGHHRYETSMNYTKKMKDLGETGNFNYIMTFLCDMNDEGLAVFPTHRVVKYNVKMVDFLKELAKDFYVKDINAEDLDATMAAEFFKGNISFGLYNGDKYALLTLKDKTQLAKEMEGSVYYRELDVAVLESMIFEKLLKFSKESIAMQEHLKYVKGFDQTIELIKNKKYDFAFIMNPTRLDQIKNVALAGEVMPQKSTYFYPKLLTGLVINKFETK